jgi:hypothetical protein
MAVTRLSAYDEILDFLTSEPTSKQLIMFRPSQAAQARKNDLLDADRNSILSCDEQGKLAEFEEVEYLMGWPKIHARTKL